MTLDQTLKNLKILAKIPKNGRIKNSSSGDIELEPERSFFLSSIFRSISADSRKKALVFIQQVMKQAFEHVDDTLRSKYMNIYDLVSSPADSDIDQHQEECRKLQYLRNQLIKSTYGLNNLYKTTYKDDASFGAEIEIIFRDIHAKVLVIDSRLERLGKKGTLPRYFPKSIAVKLGNTKPTSEKEPMTFAETGVLTSPEQSKSPETVIQKHQFLNQQPTQAISQENLGSLLKQSESESESEAETSAKLELPPDEQV